MTSLLLYTTRVLAAFVCCIGTLAYGAPLPDATFGDGGTVRIGVPAGFEDHAYASTIQSDGKVIVAGTTTGRQSYGFVTRFRTDGVADAGFAVDGTLLLTPPAGYAFLHLLQLELQADGSLIALGIVFNGFVLARIRADGALDTSFGSGGMLAVNDKGAYSGEAIRLAVQPDGKLLVVTDVSSGGNFVLRFRRFLPQGASDSSFGTNGERQLGNLPPNFEFVSFSLALAEPGGGFTLAAGPTFSGGTYLLLRVTGEGALDPTFGGVGYVSGFDAGNPRDVPLQLRRTADNRYALFGYQRSATGSIADNVVWKIDAQGASVAGFGDNGRLLLTSINAFPRSLVSLPDGGIATALEFGGAKIRISRFDANGNPVAQFGTSGSVTITGSGYQGFSPIGMHADSSGRLTVAGWGYARTIGSNNSVLPDGLDVLLASVTADGIARTDFGRGDGLAVWNNPAFSNDHIDALRFDGAGRILLVGYSDGTGTIDYLLSRLNPDGALDTSYGVAGRLSPRKNAGSASIARAVQQPDEAMVVASGEARGSFGTSVFRANANGGLDTTYKPNLVAAGPSAAVGLGVRPDGRLLFGTNDLAGFDVLQQFLPDGSPDPAFGTNGRVAFPTAGAESPRQADLVVLGDGSAVLAVFGAPGVRLNKVDAQGVPVPGFGTGGRLAYPTTNLLSRSFTGPTLLALADGTLLAAQAATGPSSPGPTQQSLLALRLSADGRVISADKLLPDEANLSWVLAALPDSSVLIARSRDSDAAQTTALYRLLPDGQFDASFGPGGAYPLSGMTRVDAMAIDGNGRLVVSGQDRTSALLARFQLSAPVGGVSVVEYFNVDLRHYFMTANAAEMANIAAGGAGPGWQRTGYGFSAYLPEVGVPIGALPVCRFYGTPGIGPNSHFYTVDPIECAAVKRDRGWTYEGTAFYAFLPVQGQCAGAAVPVYRAYNNGYARNDSNHRYATNLSLLEVLQPQGWTIEGVVLCAAN